MGLGRIAVDHRIIGGVLCVAGTRIPVATVVGLGANGLTTDEILAEYPVSQSRGYAGRCESWMTDLEPDGSGTSTVAYEDRNGPILLLTSIQ